MAFPKTGIEAVFLTKAFDSGLKSFKSGNQEAQKLAQNTAGAITRAGESVGGSFGGALAGVALIAGGVVTAVGAITAVAVRATVAIAGLTVGIGALATAAAPLEGVEFAFARMAETAGVSLQKLRDAASGTISDLDLMKRANLALVGTEGEFREMFANSLPRLLEGARAAAKATGQDINYLFESLIVGIKRSSPRLIDNTGIVIKLGEAYNEFGEAASGTGDVLTAEAQQTAVLAATMEGINNIMKVTAGSAESLTAKQSRFTATMQNLTGVLGTYFLPAAKTVMDAVNGLVQAFLNAVSEGGKLYPVMLALGAVAQMAADAFAKLLKNATDALTGTTNEFTSGFSKLVSDFFNWGSEIVFALADGIIQGASAAINAVANAINSLMGWWFEPSSPPRVLPDIDKWGAGAMEAYLQGFSEADFSQLKDLQSPLKAVFDLFVDQGKLAKDTAGKMWADVSKSMITGLSSGDLSETIAKISNTAGDYAGALINLIQRNQELARATQDVSSAEKALDDSRKKATALDSKRAKLIAEYNQLVRQGASKTLLASKMAEINATEQAQAAALEEVKANELRVDTAKEQAENVKEQVDMAKQLLAVLTDIAKAEAIKPEAKKLAAGAGAGKKVGGGALGELEEPDFSKLGTTLADRIKGEIERMRLILKIAWRDMWWDIGQQFKPLTDAWENLKKAFEPIRQFMMDNTPWEAFKILISGLWEKMTTGFSDMMQQINFKLDEWRLRLKIWWRDTWWEIGEHLKTVATDMVTKGQEIVGGILIGLVAKWVEVTTWATETWDSVKEGFNAQIELLKTIAKNIIAGVHTGLVEKWVEITTWATTTWDEIKTKFTDQIENFKTIGSDIIGGLKSGIESAWKELVKWAEGIVKNLPKAVKKVLWMESPSKVFAEIGMNIPRGLAEGIAAGAQDVARSMSSMIGAAAQPVMAAQPISTSNVYNSTLNLGGVNLSGNLTLTQFEAMLNRVVSRSH